MLIKIDLSAISFLDWMKFATLVRSGQTRNAINIIDRYIVEWEYDIPVEKGLRALPSVIDVNKCIRVILETVQKEIDSYNPKDVSVDLSKWTFDTYESWEQARVDKNWVLTESMVHEVAKLPATNKDTPLNCIDGLRMVTAIVKEHENSFLEQN